MPDPIVNPEAIVFVDERLRPICERLERLHAELGSAWGKWLLVSSHFGEVEAVVEDGRESEGVSQLSGGDVGNVMAQIQSLLTLLDGAGVMDVIRKPTVRPLQIAS
ncbi:MAG: hypothetical protein KAV00_00990 [Phycisphaerae bacterium]|nr:hypothetical protein [Phycisphaerae bacterium]